MWKTGDFQEFWVHLCPLGENLSWVAQLWESSELGRWWQVREWEWRTSSCFLDAGTSSKDVTHSVPPVPPFFPRTDLSQAIKQFICQPWGLCGSFFPFTLASWLRICVWKEALQGMLHNQWAGKGVGLHHTIQNLASPTLQLSNCHSEQARDGAYVSFTGYTVEWRKLRIQQSSAMYDVILRSLASLRRQEECAFGYISSQITIMDQEECTERGGYENMRWYGQVVQRGDSAEYIDPSLH